MSSDWPSWPEWTPPFQEVSYHVDRYGTTFEGETYRLSVQHPTSQTVVHLWIARQEGNYWPQIHTEVVDESHITQRKEYLMTNLPIYIALHVL